MSLHHKQKETCLLAQAEHDEMYKTLGSKPVHGTLAFHWARLIELLYATERTLELCRDSEITSANVRAKPGEPGEGIGVVEAARGTLFHHYTLDNEALITDVNMIVATTNNYPAICMSVRDAAKGLIHGGKVDPSVLNKVEMAFRAFFQAIEQAVFGELLYLCACPAVELLRVPLRDRGAVARVHDADDIEPLFLAGDIDEEQRVEAACAT
jgi:coenzyme F420-reducing hydrogenase alpha subunit